MSGSLSDSTAVNVGASGTYALSADDTVGSIEGSGAINLGSSELTSGGLNANTTFSGVMSGTGGKRKSGSGTLTFSGSNTYSGPTRIDAGTLTVSGSLSDSTDVAVANGATYSLGSNDTIGSLAGAGDVSLSSYTLVSGQSGESTTFSGAISGSGGFKKIGAGRQVSHPC